MTSRYRVVLSSVVIVALAGLGAWWFVGHGSAGPTAGPPAGGSRHMAAMSGHDLGASSSDTTVPAPSTTTTTSTSTTTTSSTTSTTTSTTTPHRVVTQQVPTNTLIATISPSGVAGSETPGGPATIDVPGEWWGAPSRLPVLAEKRGWVEVRLAQRPNESTAWVPAHDVTLAGDPYAIVINLATTHLELFHAGREVGDFPAGVGTPTDPTPPGQFFVAFFAPPPSPGYGAFLLVTSAHSDAITDWEGTGDAIIAIHGPLGADALIGTTGARISHGCIRLHDADLDQLGVVPAGTPIDIVD